MLFLRKIGTLSSDAGILVLACMNKRTPFTSKLIICVTFIYLISPIDLISDFIPMVGWLDDLMIVPALIHLSIKQLPPYVLEEARLKRRKHIRKLKLLILGFLILLSFLLGIIFF